MKKERLVKTMLLCISLSIAFLWPASNLLLEKVVAYESGNGKTHEWIFKQARTILENDSIHPYEYIVDFLDSQDPYYEPGHTYLDTLIKGGDDADDPFFRARSHYMDPTDHYGLFDDELDILFESAGKVCQQNFTDALIAWNAGNKSDAMYKLGFAIHIVQDLCVPHHAFPTAIYGHSEYETWVDNNKANYAVDSGGIYSFDSFPDYENYVASNMDFPRHYVWDSWDSAFAWVDYNAHESIKHFARVNKVTGPVIDDYTIKTVDPLPNDLVTWWNITEYGATEMNLLFTRIRMQQNDYVRIYDANDVLQESYTDCDLIGVWANVTGDTLKIKIETDSTIQSHGYETNILTFWDDCSECPCYYDEATEVLLKQAQKTTAGFIYFFFRSFYPPWDITGEIAWVPDGKCNIRDIALIASFFGSQEGDGKYDSRADITGGFYLEPDGKINIRDIALVAKHFGETYY